MWETSRDTLNLTLAASVGVLTILLAWLLIYAIRILKTVADVSRRIDATLRLAEDALTTLRDRARDLASILPVVMKAVDKLVTYVGERKRARKSSSSMENDEVQSSNVK